MPQKYKRRGGLSSLSSDEAPRAQTPPPPPIPAGLPTPVGEILPWLLISIACFSAFLWLPGRVSSPRSRVTLIGGNEFLNVASHLHFCVWIWPVHDLVLRILGILLFPPKRAAVFFLSMFQLPPPGVVAAAAEGGDASISDTAKAGTAAAAGGGFVGALAQLFRMVRSLLVQPAPNELDYVPADFTLAGNPELGPVPRGSSYWGYRTVAAASCVVMVLFWMFCTYMYHTRHVLRESNVNAERRKQSAKKKKEAREKLIERIKKGEVDEEKITEAERANLAENEFSDEDVDYDPYGRPVPEPPYVPVVSWMALFSLVFSSAYVWVGGMSLLMGSLFPVAICGVLAFCIMCPGQ